MDSVCLCFRDGRRGDALLSNWSICICWSVCTQLLSWIGHLVWVCVGFELEHCSVCYFNTAWFKSLHLPSLWVLFVFCNTHTLSHTCTQTVGLFTYLLLLYACAPRIDIACLCLWLTGCWCRLMLQPGSVKTVWVAVGLWLFQVDMCINCCFHVLSEPSGCIFSAWWIIFRFISREGRGDIQQYPPPLPATFHDINTQTHKHAINSCTHLGLRDLSPHIHL